MNKIKLCFEDLQENDLDEVAQLYDAERPMTTNRTKMIKTYNKMKNNEIYKMIVAKYNGIIVGFAFVFIHDDIFEENNPFITIWDVRVKKDYRRQKIGSQLFLYIENIAKGKNCEFISLIAEKDNEIANAFYQSLNYSLENGYMKIIKKD